MPLANPSSAHISGMKMACSIECKVFLDLAKSLRSNADELKEEDQDFDRHEGSTSMPHLMLNVFRSTRNDGTLKEELFVCDHEGRHRAMYHLRNDRSTMKVCLVLNKVAATIIGEEVYGKHEWVHHDDVLQKYVAVHRHLYFYKQDAVNFDMGVAVSVDEDSYRGVLQQVGDDYELTYRFVANSDESDADEDSGEESGEESDEEESDEEESDEEESDEESDEEESDESDEEESDEESDEDEDETSEPNSKRAKQS